MAINYTNFELAEYYLPYFACISNSTTHRRSRIYIAIKDADKSLYEHFSQKGSLDDFNSSGIGKITKKQLERILLLGIEEAKKEAREIRLQSQTANSVKVREEIERSYRKVRTKKPSRPGRVKMNWRRK